MKSPWFFIQKQPCLIKRSYLVKSASVKRTVVEIEALRNDPSKLLAQYFVVFFGHLTAEQRAGGNKVPNKCNKAVWNKSLSKS